MEIVTSLLDLGNNLLVAGDSNGVLIVNYNNNNIYINIIINNNIYIINNIKINIYINNNININNILGVELYEWIARIEVQHPQWLDQLPNPIQRRIHLW